MEQPTRELEWFDLENRTRDVVHQQLDPVLARAKEDREMFANLKTYCQKLEKRVKELEVSVLGDKPQETVISKIYETCSAIEGQRKKDVVKINQDLNQIREQIKDLGFLNGKNNEEIICIHKNEITTEDKLVSIKNTIEDNKNIVIEEISKLDANFKNLNSVYNEVSIKAEERSIIAMSKAQTNTMEMGNYKREVENIRKASLETLTQIREIKANKLDESEYTVSIEQFSIKFSDLNDQIAKLKDEISHRDRFIDRFIPLQTATMISDYLHSCIEPSRQKTLAEFESQVLQNLNNSVISSEPIESRDTKARKILEGMKQMEERKVNLMIDTGKKTPELLGKNKKPQFKNKRETEETTTQSPTYERDPLMLGPDIEEIEKIIDRRINPIQSSILKTLQDEISQKQESNKGYFKAIIQENNNLLNQVIHDFEENSKSFKREFSQLSKDVLNIKNTDDDKKKALKGFENSIEHLTKMVVCLVENAQIEQALESQDEEDRHAMVRTYDKELQNDMVLNKSRATPEPYTSTLPSGLALQKKCLGCGNNASLISGYKTTVMYKPTPLMYRNKKFERPALISFRGKMVKECWGKVSMHIPWKQDDMENLVNDVYSNVKSTTVNFDDDVNNLPILSSATTAVRNKSQPFRKTRINRGSFNFSLIP